MNYDQRLKLVDKFLKYLKKPQFDYLVTMPDGTDYYCLPAEEIDIICQDLVDIVTEELVQ